MTYQKNKIWIIITLMIISLSLFSFKSFSQEQIGLRLDNYAGVSALTLNPGYNSIADQSWDINLVQAEAFGSTSLAYLENQSILSYFLNINDIVFSTDGKYPNLRAGQIPVRLNYDVPGKKHIMTMTGIMGPSFMFKINQNNSVGLFTRVRGGYSHQNIPEDFNLDMIKNNQNQRLSLSASNSAGMVWSEIGFNYRFTQEYNDGVLTLGGNIKYLTGHEAFYVDLARNVEIVNLGNNNYSLDLPKLSLGYTRSDIENTNRLTNNGRGLGFDLGATFMNSLNPDDYKWKFGVSLVDVGRISYNKQIRNYNANIDNINLIDLDDIEIKPTLDEMIQDVARQVAGNIDAFKNSNNINIWLPMGLVLNGDYQITKNTYLNALLVQRVNISRKQLKRGNILAITPRYDTKLLGFSLPFNLYNYKEARVGAALRLGFLTIGTSDITTFTKAKKLDSFDAYVAVKFNPYLVPPINFKSENKKKKYKNRRDHFKKRKWAKNVKCYDF